MGPVSIDVTGMRHLVAQLDAAARAVGESAARVDRALADVRIDDPPGPFLRAEAGWLASHRPDLTRRIAAAEEADAPPTGLLRADAGTAPPWAAPLPSVVPSVFRRPEDARREADRLGTLIRADLRAGRSPSPATVATVRRYADDPRFATAFAAEVPPEELNRWGVDVLDRARRRAGPEQWLDDVLTADEKAFFAAVGATVAAATRAGEGAGLPRGYARRYARTIEASLPDQGLAPFLRDGRYGTAFLVEVGGTIDRFERPPGDAPPWGAAPPDPAADVTASYFAALGRNGEAAQAFFAPARRPDRERLDFYLTRRKWAEPDGGVPLGAALVAATVDERKAGPRTAARLTGLLVDLLGRPDAPVLPAMRPALGRILADYIDDIARLAGPTGGDGVETGTSPEDDTYGVQNPSLAGLERRGPRLREDRTVRLVGEVLADPVAARRVLAAAAAHAVRLFQAVEDDARPDRARPAREAAQLFGFLAGSATRAAVLDGEDRDRRSAQFARWTATAVKAVGAAVSASTGSTAVAVGVEVAAILTEDALRTDIAEEARTAGDRRYDGTRVELSELVVAILAARGALTGPLSPYSDPGDGVPPIGRGSTRDFLDARGRLIPEARRTDDQQGAYDVYLRRTDIGLSDIQSQADTTFGNEYRSVLGST